jgi:hypothetical protein
MDPAVLGAIGICLLVVIVGLLLTDPGDAPHKGDLPGSSYDI